MQMINQLLFNWLYILFIQQLAVCLPRPTGEKNSQSLTDINVNLVLFLVGTSTGDKL